MTKDFDVAYELDEAIYQKSRYVGVHYPSVTNVYVDIDDVIERIEELKNEVVDDEKDVTKRDEAYLTALTTLKQDLEKYKKGGETSG